MNYFNEEADFSRYDEVELLTLSLTYLVDIEDLTVNTVDSDY